MKKITQEEAKRLITEGGAGWYSINSNAPLPHPARTVVGLGQDYYLTVPEEFELRSLGPGQLPTPSGAVITKAVFVVEVKSEELQAIFKAAINKQTTPLDLGLDIPSRYGGNEPGPHERNQP